MTKWRARNLRSPTSSSCGERNVASSRKTSTPNDSKRSCESSGASSARAARIWAKTSLKSKSGFGALIPQRSRMPHAVEQAGRRDERLARDTTEIEAVTSHLVALDQCHSRAERDRSGRGDETGGSGADHDQIVNAVAFFHDVKRKMAAAIPLETAPLRNSRVDNVFNASPRLRMHLISVRHSA